MQSRGVSGIAGDGPLGGELSRVLTVMLLSLAALLILAYWPMLTFTWTVLVESEDMAHGFFAPIVAASIAWQKRDIVVQTRDSASAWGLAILALSALVAVVASIGSSATLSRFAFMGSLSGASVLWGGWPLLRTLAFPILLLLYTFPIPPVLYGEITQPLQLLASATSEWTLDLIGYSVLREGNILQLPNQRLSVVEACSGIRSLVTLSFFCLVYAELMENRNWLRAVLVIASLPAAILVNTMRITTTAMIGEARPDLTKGLAHESLGWVLFLVGFGLVVLLHFTLQRMIGKRESKRL